MPFPLNIYLLAGLGAFGASLLSLPWWRFFCRRAGLVDDPGQRKIHSEPVALAGGLAVLTGLLAPLAAGWFSVEAGLLPASSLAGLTQEPGASATALLHHGFQHRGLQLVAILLGALGMAGVGCLDDKYELAAGPKFAGQLFIGLLTAAAGVRVTLFVDNVLFSYAVTVLWILTVTNAFNFMDNMNGLCAGLGAVGAWCIGLVAMIHVQYLVASISFLVCGALAGFLPYNYPRATAFLGDTGSHVTGYLLAVLAILPHFYSAQNPRPLAVLTPLVILAIPLLDLARVVLLRWRLGKPFYIGDTNHLSHRLVASGLSPARAVMMIWLGSTLLGALAVIWN